MIDEVNTASSSPASRMGLVTRADDEFAPVVLVVDNNPMSQRRVAQALRARNLTLIECEDGDRAVDMYVEHEPDLVIMALDIPSLDGHIAALEMRERDEDARIVFLAPRRLSDLAQNATYSAGAVAWIEKPPASTTFDEVWPRILGPIPEAPGLADLDELYPEEESEEAPLPTPPLLGLPPLEGLPPLGSGESPPFGIAVPAPVISDEYPSMPTARSIKRRVTRLMALLFMGLVGGYLWSFFGDIPYI